MRENRFLYFCINLDTGKEFTFTSKALLDTGFTFLDDDGSTILVEDMDIDRCFSAKEYSMAERGYDVI